jgi:PAS domain S-box-containing protein
VIPFSRKGLRLVRTKPTGKITWLSERASSETESESVANEAAGVSVGLKQLISTHQNSPLPVWLWDPDRGRIVWGNRAAAGLFAETSPSDLNDRRFPKEDRLRAALTAVAERLRPGGCVHETLPIVGDEATLSVTAEIVGTELPDARPGLFVRVQATSRDADDSPRARAAVIMDALDWPLALFDGRGRLLEANTTFREEYGFTGDEALQDLLDDDYASEGLIGRVLGAGEWSRTRPVTTKLATRLHRITAKRIADPASGAALIMVALTDIADRHAFEQMAVDVTPLDPSKVLAPDQINAAILEALPDAGFVLNQDGKIIAINRHAPALLGLTAGDLIDHPFAELLDAGTRADFADYIVGLSAGALGRSFAEGRDVQLSAKGRDQLFVLTLAPFSAAEGMAHLAIARPLNSLRQSLAHAIKERDDARRESGRKSSFIASVSHELRTPLNAIIGFTQVMREERLGPLGNQRYAGYVRDIHASGELLLSLVNELLDLTKAEAGRMDLKPESLDVSELITGCVRMVAPLAERYGVEVRQITESGLPRVVADKRSVSQVVINLLSNAIKFNKPGGHATVVAAEVSGAMVITVEDSGLGMTSEQLKQALEPYGRPHHGNDSREGTGLGLPLAKVLTEANKAEFVIESDPNRGTKVRVIFPSPLVLPE